MKTGKLKKKILKEFAKSPAKTMILIALCPVALYFIVPLLLPGKSQGIDAQKAPMIAPNIIPVATTAGLAAPQAALPTGPSWTQLNDWIEADGRHLPGTIQADQRDPFQAPIVDVVQAETVRDAPPEPDAPAAFTQANFDALGFRLTGTVVGRKSRLATINGKWYLEGGPIKPLASQRGAGPMTNLEFVLRHIGPDHAILVRDGLSFRLDLRPTQPLDQSISVMRKPVATSD